MKKLAAVGRILALMFMFTLAGSAHATTDVAGIKFDDTAKVGTQDLKFNGAGIRYKAIFKVYAIGLYLQDRKGTAHDVFNAPGARRVQIGVLRDLSSEEFGRAFLAGINQNIDRNDKTKIVGQLLKFGEIFASIPELKKGDIVTTDWVPGTGTVIQVNGKRIAEPLPDLQFYNAILKIWLGDKPVEPKLKQAMLGEKPDEPSRNN
ncbi:lipoprotein transmembrane [Oxalobacteraceae bacterium OM1]|nr:lipoprotein transmembrane [Oxalobacteraceae bacterium OM1]